MSLVGSTKTGVVVSPLRLIGPSTPSIRNLFGTISLRQIMYLLPATPMATHPQVPEEATRLLQPILTRIILPSITLLSLSPHLDKVMTFFRYFDFLVFVCELTVCVCYPPQACLSTILLTLVLILTAEVILPIL